MIGSNHITSTQAHGNSTKHAGVVAAQIKKLRKDAAIEPGGFGGGEQKAPPLHVTSAARPMAGT